MTQSCRNVLITGSRGFIGKNIISRLREFSSFKVLTFVRTDDVKLLPELIAKCDVVIHLAGENRPNDESLFEQVNAGLTSALCEAIACELLSNGRTIPLLFASSSQADSNNPYGKSKLSAEKAVLALANTTGNPCVIFRLPGVFGKWCNPNYNSVVATFCHNIARGLPIQINDPSKILKLVYIDDVVSAFIAALDSPNLGFTYGIIQPEYTVQLGELASQIYAFENCRTNLQVERVGVGFVRALYSTYVSYLPSEKLSYEVPKYDDPRGRFVEMLKTPDCGQFSYFFAKPGVTRGGHYHHTKTEKFLVIKGEALFRFRHIMTNELVELYSTGEKPEIVDTIPGWAHDITNIGNEEMIVILWACENYDREKPDTVAEKV